MNVTKWAQLRGVIIRTRNVALSQVYSSTLQREVLGSIEGGAFTPDAIAADINLNLARVRRVLKLLQSGGILDEQLRIASAPEVVTFGDSNEALAVLKHRVANPLEVLPQIAIALRPELAELQRSILAIVAGNGGACQWSPVGISTKLFEAGFPACENDVQSALLALVDAHLLIEQTNRRLRAFPGWAINWAAVAKLAPPVPEWKPVKEPPIKRCAMEGKLRAAVLDEFPADSLELLFDRLEFPAGATHRKTLIRLLRIVDADNGARARDLRELCELDDCERGPLINRKTAALALRELVAAGFVEEHANGYARFRWLRWSFIANRLRESIVRKAYELPAERYPTPHKPTKVESPEESMAAMYAPVVVGVWGEASGPNVPPVGKSVPTLRAVAEKFVFPKLKSRNRKRATVNSIRKAIVEWEAYFPADFWNVRQIRTKHFERWQRKLQQSGLSAATVNRYMRGIVQVMRAGEKHRIIKSVPSAEMLPVIPATKYYLTPENVAKLWDAADGMSWPRINGITAAEFWKCAIVLLWTYGFRTQELISFDDERPSLKWSGICFEVDTPNPGGEAKNAFGWLTYTPQKQSWAKPTPLYLPLTPTARAALEILQGAKSQSDGRVFPVPRGSSAFYKAWVELQAKADLSLKDGGTFQLKAFRRSAATYLENHRHGLGGAVGGWADRESSGVMTKHYRVTEGMLVEQLATYKVPECFESLLLVSVSAETPA